MVFMSFKCHKYHPLTTQNHFDSEDDYRSACRNVNSSFQSYTHSDDHTKQTTDTPGCKPFTNRKIYYDFFQICTHKRDEGSEWSS